MTDINVVLISVSDPKFHEAVALNEDGSYTVFINSRMATNKMREAYDHAIRHIENNDFERFDVQQIEADAHQNAL